MTVTINRLNTRNGATDTIVVDPNGAFKGVPHQRLIEAAGLIPHFIVPGDKRPFRAQLESSYQWGVYEIEGGSIDEDGTYHSAYEEPTDEEPGDPPMAPMIAIAAGKETLYIYESAIVGIRQKDDGSSFVTRLD